MLTINRQSNPIWEQADKVFLTKNRAKDTCLFSTSHVPHLSSICMAPDASGVLDEELRNSQPSSSIHHPPLPERMSLD